MNLDQFKILGDLDKHDYIKSNFPASAHSISLRNLVCGVAVNDAAFVSSPSIGGKQVQNPCYRAWVSMLQRCYDKKCQERNQTYIGCSVSKEWLHLSNFQYWWESNQVDGWCLDKDIICFGNKVYSPEHCAFVPTMINTFVNDCRALRGEWPIGVSFEKRCKKFQAQCCNPLTGKRENLGQFTDPELAHYAWRERKLELIPIICSRFPGMDQRVEQALIKRYSQQGILS